MDKASMSHLVSFSRYQTKYVIKGMLRRNIEHFLKKRKYEKLGFSEMS